MRTNSAEAQNVEQPRTLSSPEAVQNVEQPRTFRKLPRTFRKLPEAVQNVQKASQNVEQPRSSPEQSRKPPEAMEMHVTSAGTQWECVQNKMLTMIPNVGLCTHTVLEYSRDAHNAFLVAQKPPRAPQPRSS